MNYPPLEKRAEDAAGGFVREMFDCLNLGPEKRTPEGWQDVIAWWLREVSQRIPVQLHRPQDQLNDIRFEAKRFYHECLKVSRHKAMIVLAFEDKLCYSIMLTMGWYRWSDKPSDIELEHFTHFLMLGGIVPRMLNDGRYEDGPTGYVPTSATARLKNAGLPKNEFISVQLRRRLN